MQQQAYEDLFKTPPCNLMGIAPAEIAQQQSEPYGLRGSLVTDSCSQNAAISESDFTCVSHSKADFSYCSFVSVAN